MQEFICDNCDTKVTATNAKARVCPKCGADMRWLCGGGIREGDYHHTSSSLAINPCQTKVHRKLFPGIDVDIATGN